MIKSVFENKQLLTYQQKNQTYLSQYQILQQNQNLIYKNKKQKKRLIPDAPEKILDAPDLKDDYYLNLIDWSESDIISISLGNSLYLLQSDGVTQNLMNLQNDYDYISSVSWMQQANCLAVGLSDSTIQLWDPEKESLIRTMTGHSQRVSSLSWNQCVLSSGSKDKNIINHDVRTKNHIISSFKSHLKEVCGLKWSPQGNYLASGGNDNQLFVWDNNTMGQQNAKPLYQMDSHQAAVKALAWCPWQQNILASGGGTQDRTMKFWNIDSGSLINQIQSQSQFCAIQFSKLDKEIITAHGFRDNQICIWNYPSLQLQEIIQKGELQGHTNRVLHLALSPDGDRIVSASADETLRFWKLYDLQKNKKKKDKIFIASPIQIR